MFVFGLRSAVCGQAVCRLPSAVCGQAVCLPIHANARPRPKYHGHALACYAFGVYPSWPWLLCHCNFKSSSMFVFGLRSAVCGQAVCRLPSAVCGQAVCLPIHANARPRPKYHGHALACYAFGVYPSWPWLLCTAISRASPAPSAPSTQSF